MEMQCIQKLGGGAKSDYFNVGDEYGYRDSQSDQYWSGKIAETTFYDGFTGDAMSNKTVIAYVAYNESHWYWKNDEHWVFNLNQAGNYFFALQLETK